MIELRYNGWAPHVKCNWCGEKLLLENKTDYKKCVNCSGEYMDENMTIYQINGNYRWRIEYDRDLQIFVKLLKLKSGWFGIKYWGGCVRGRLIELKRDFKGSEVGCRQGFYYVHTFNTETFSLKETLIEWHKEYLAHQASIKLQEQDLLKSIKSIH